MATYLVVGINKSHAKTYRSLRLRSFEESPLAFSESYQDEKLKSVTTFALELEAKGTPIEHFVLGAFTVSDELVGFVTFKRDTRSKARHKSMIHAMYVAPEVRGKSIGKLLMEALFTKVKAIEGLEQIHLWVLHANDISASDFYKKLGFESQGTAVKKDLKIGDTYIDAEYMVMYL